MRIFGLWLAALALTGCATQASYTSKAMALNMDMSKEQVVGLMGPPRNSSARKTPDGMVERYSWWSPKLIGFTPIDSEMVASDRVFVRFLNGKVVEWGDKYDFSETMEKSRESQAEIMKGMGARTVAAPASAPAR